MKQENFLNSFGKIDPAYIEEADATIAGQGAASTRPHRRRFPIALVAAIMCLFLMGAGVAAVIYGDNIQNWFGYYYQSITGQEMGESQTALIDHLSQDIGQSQTVGDVTVTVDSATVGDDIYYMLLRVEGIELSQRHGCMFDMLTVEVSPDPLNDAGGSVGYGAEFCGIDGDGAALLLFSYEYLADEGYKADTRPLEVDLILENLMRNGNGEENVLLAEGRWNFSFTIDRSQPLEIMSLPNTEVVADNLETGEDEYVLLTNIELTNTGLRFQFDAKEGTLTIDSHIEVILKSGAAIGVSGGSGSEMDDSTVFVNTYQWRIPISIEDVAAIKFEEIEIPVNP